MMHLFKGFENMKSELGFVTCER